MIIDGFVICYDSIGWGGFIPGTDATLGAETLSDLTIKIDRYRNGQEGY